MIPHNRPCLSREEEAAAVRVLRSNWIAQGPEVQAFEAETAAFLGLEAGQAVAVSSGSAALYLALSALGVAGEAVGVPAYSCRALGDATTLAGATPEWLDVSEDSPNIDPATSGTRVTVVAHMFGMPARVPTLPGRRYVEDCAQAIGAMIDGLKVGTIGDVGIFSFAATKLLTAGGQGGMVVSGNAEIARAVREARDYDALPDRTRRFNFQMTDLQAAVGRVQLARLSGFLRRREAIWRRYREAGADLLDSADAGTEPVRFRAVLHTEDPDRWRDAFEKAGIATIVPVASPELPAPVERLPNADRLTQETLSLPVHPGLSDEDVARIADVVERVARP